MRSVRLKDVASAAGVSVATASRALTGRGRVSSGTVARVTQVAERLGYQAHEIGRALREGSIRTVGAAPRARRVPGASGAPGAGGGGARRAADAARRERARRRGGEGAHLPPPALAEDG